MMSDQRVRQYRRTGIEYKPSTPEYRKEYYRKFLAGNKKSRYVEPREEEEK